MIHSPSRHCVTAMMLFCLFTCDSRRLLALHAIVSCDSCPSISSHLISSPARRSRSCVMPTPCSLRPRAPARQAGQLQGRWSPRWSTTWRRRGGRADPQAPEDHGLRGRPSGPDYSALSRQGPLASVPPFLQAVAATVLDVLPVRGCCSSHPRGHSAAASLKGGVCASLT